MQGETMRMRILFLSLFTLLLFGCSTLSVTSDYDSSFNFSSYHTYRWAKAPDSTEQWNVLVTHPFIYGRIKNAVDRGLAAKGYLLKAAGPVDFTISASANVMERAQIDPQPPYYWRSGVYRGRYGWYSAPWWGPDYAYPPMIYYYEVGTLFLDIIDAARKEVAWRGVARGILHDYRNTDKMQADIDEAINKLLAEFPPGRK
jgi:hypothetical protein